MLINLVGRFYHHHGALLHTYLDFFTTPPTTPSAPHPRPHTGHHLLLLHHHDTEEITTAFATVATTFQPISGQPSDDDLTEACDVLYPLLLDIPHDEDGTHNLIGLIEPTASYTATWAHNSLPRNAHLLIPSSTMQQLQSSEHAERPNMPSWSVTLPHTKRLNEQQRNSSTTPSTKSCIVTSAMIDPSTHTSRQNNSSRTSTTTAGASTPASS
eukprot:CCRYP_009758-RA/>CCRYP_009758-RA protein AED:0.37 eAED:0.37 QI:0/-1/0/1/-1/1/1/685/212